MSSLLRTAAMARSVTDKTKIASPTATVQHTTDERSMHPAAIDRIIERNIVRFFGRAIPAAAIDVVRVDGKTMREQMRLDRLELLRSGRMRADPIYFGQLKKTYIAALTGHAVVALLNPEETVPPGLVTAVESADHTAQGAETGAHHALLVAVLRRSQPEERATLGGRHGGDATAQLHQASDVGAGSLRGLRAVGHVVHL